jgi:glyceraldehyde-3-phosphate dehydrogenase (NADP+)
MEMLLAGAWVDRPERIEVRDPFDNSLVDTVPSATMADVETALAAAVEGAKLARALPAFERARILTTVGRVVEDRGDYFAQTIAREGSKTIREARKEVSRCVNTLRSSAEEARRIHGETIPFDTFPGGEQRRGYFERVPVGVVLAITPFNDPLNLVAHKLGPAIAAGNAVILKPATVTPLSALELTRAFVDAGLPQSTLQTLTGSGSVIGDPLVSDERVRMISFTGGVEAGKHITSRAGIKKIGMELGSNSPVIVWQDADITWAVESCVSGAFWAAGQNCIGVQRIYVHEEIFAKFRDDFVERTASYRIGDKLNEATDMGPMITEQEAERVVTWVRAATQAGAEVLTGGERSGALVQPTVLERVPKSVQVHCQEVFGPTVNLYSIRDADEAIAEANSLPFGLHAALFTQNVDMAFNLASGLECGGVMINDSTDYRLDSMPFGGIKYSGLGREGVRFSIEEMTETKVVCWLLRES